MDEKEITEGNRIILLFSGFKIETIKNSVTLSGETTHRTYDVYLRGDTRCEEDYISTLFPFHKYFSLLMTVIDEISSLGFTVIIKRSDMTTCSINKNNGDEYIARIYSKTEDPIHVVWKAVVKFLKWYNENKK